MQWGTNLPEHSNLPYRKMAREPVTVESGWLSKYNNLCPTLTIIKGKKLGTAWQLSKRLNRKYVIHSSKCRNPDAGAAKTVCVCVFEENRL